jgi:uncharacterized membrane protein YidH (DUF202 family)
MTDPDLTQNELAKERTHAAWVRTCLTFLVTAIAVRHYTSDDGEWMVATILAVGGAVSAVRASFLAPDLVSKLMAYAMALVSLGALVVNI